MVRIPGYSGATTTVTTQMANTWATNSIKVDTIFYYEGKFCIDGKFWVPDTAGALLGWEY